VLAPISNEADVEMFKLIAYSEVMYPEKWLSKGW